MANRALVFLAFFCAVSLSSTDVCKPTSSDTLGPFYFKNPPQLLKYCTGDVNPKNRLLVSGHVYGYDCVTKLPETVIEVWQADHSGVYRSSADCRGYLRTDKNGYYEFTTNHPGRYKVKKKPNSYRPVHIHYKIHPYFDHEGLVTQLYFAGDPYLGPFDSCKKCSSGRPDLVKNVETMCNDDNSDCIDTVTFDIYLAKRKQTRRILTFPIRDLAPYSGLFGAQSGLLLGRTRTGRCNSIECL